MTQNITGGSFIDRFKNKKNINLEEQISELKSTNSRLESKIKCYQENCKNNCNCSICESKFTNPNLIFIPQKQKSTSLTSNPIHIIEPTTNSPLLTPNKYDISTIPYSDLNSQNIKLKLKPKSKPKPIISQSSIFTHTSLAELEKNVKEEEKKKILEEKIKLEKEKELKKLEKNKYGSNKCFVLEFNCVITISSWFNFINNYNKWLNDVKTKSDQATVRYLENPAIQSYLKDISTKIFNITKSEFSDEKIKELVKEINKARNIEINGKNVEKTGTSLLKEFIMGFENRIMQLKLFLSRLKSKGVNIYVLPTSMMFYIKLLLNIVNIPETLLNVDMIKDMQNNNFKHINNFNDLAEERNLKQIELTNKCRVYYINNKDHRLGNPIDKFGKDNISYYEVDNTCGLLGRDMNIILEKNNLAKILMVGGNNKDSYYKKYLKYKKKYLLVKY